MNYNIFISTQTSKYNILDINDADLTIVIDAYKYGKNSFFINGKKYFIGKLLEIVIATFNHPSIKTKEDFLEICDKNGKIDKFLGFGGSIKPGVLEHFGENVTNNFIKNEFGFLNDERITKKLNENYVNLQRIDEISNIKDTLDYTKLIAYLKELNITFSNNLFLSIPLIVRAIIDHIPPVFNKTNFSDVCGSYGNRSFQDSMNNLNKSSRKIADAFLHTQIRRKEVLPNRTQIDFRNDLDVLLQEIVRIKK